MPGPRIGDGHPALLAMTAAQAQTPAKARPQGLARLVPAGVLAAAVGVGVGVLLGSSGSPAQTQPSLAPASPSEISSAAVAQISSAGVLPGLHLKTRAQGVAGVLAAGSTATGTGLLAGSTKATSTGTPSTGSSTGHTKTGNTTTFVE
jgi:hypothetical protein